MVVKSPCAGRVTSISVKAGDEVRDQEVLCTIKQGSSGEQEVKAETAGKIIRVQIEKDDLVSKGQELVTIQ